MNDAFQNPWLGYTRKEERTQPKRDCIEAHYSVTYHF